jgi:hypothetical protein
MIGDRPFSRDQIVELLRELGAELDGLGLRGEMFVVGGAAMALAYNIRRSTRDIDAVFEPKATIYQMAARIAQHHGLDRNWLNDSVKGLLPGPDQAPQEVVELPGLRVSVASPRYLLALKVAAARVDRDADDIRFLAEVCGLRSAREILDLTEDIIGRHRPLAAKVQFLVEEMFPTVQ